MKEVDDLIQSVRTSGTGTDPGVTMLDGVIRLIRDSAGDRRRTLDIANALEAKRGQLVAGVVGSPDPSQQAQQGATATSSAASGQGSQTADTGTRSRRGSTLVPDQPA
jgi:hypothetical protein